MKFKNWFLCILALLGICTTTACQDKNNSSANSDSGTTGAEQNANSASDEKLAEPKPIETTKEIETNDQGIQVLGEDDADTTTVSESNVSNNETDTAKTGIEDGQTGNPDADDADSDFEADTSDKTVHVEGHINEYGEQELGGDDDEPETVNTNEEITNPTDEDGNEIL